MLVDWYLKISQQYKSQFFFFFFQESCYTTFTKQSTHLRSEQQGKPEIPEWKDSVKLHVKMSGFQTAEELGPFLEFITGTQPGRRNSAFFSGYTRCGPVKSLLLLLIFYVIFFTSHLKPHIESSFWQPLLFS